MRLLLTVRELMDTGRWQQYCEVTGCNSYAVAEGLANDSDDIVLTEDEARDIGLVFPRQGGD
jgi:hypothetical protein